MVLFIITMTLNAITHKAGGAFAMESALQICARRCGAARIMQTET